MEVGLDRDLIGEISWHPDGAAIDVCYGRSFDEGRNVWGVTTFNSLTGIQISGRDMHEDDNAMSIVHSPNGEKTAIGFYSGQVDILDMYDLPDNADEDDSDDDEPCGPPRTFGVNSSGLSSVLWCLNGTRVVSGHSDGTIKIWDVRLPCDKNIPRLGERVLKSILPLPPRQSTYADREFLPEDIRSLPIECSGDLVVWNNKICQIPNLRVRSYNDFKQVLLLLGLRKNEYDNFFSTFKVGDYSQFRDLLFAAQNPKRTNDDVRRIMESGCQIEDEHTRDIFNMFTDLVFSNEERSMVFCTSNSTEQQNESTSANNPVSSVFQQEPDVMEMDLDFKAN